MVVVLVVVFAVVGSRKLLWCAFGGSVWILPGGVDSLVRAWHTSFPCQRNQNVAKLHSVRSCNIPQSQQYSAAEEQEAKKGRHQRQREGKLCICVWLFCQEFRLSCRRKRARRIRQTPREKCRHYLYSRAVACFRILLEIGQVRHGWGHHWRSVRGVLKTRLTRTVSLYRFVETGAETLQ